jgi:hypothetical protein
MTRVAAWRKNRTDSSPAAIRNSRHREGRLRADRSAIRWDRRTLSNQPSVPDHSKPACVRVPEHSNAGSCTAPALLRHHSESMRKAYWDPQHALVLARQAHRFPSANVGELRRTSTATSRISPSTVRSSFPCACWIWSSRACLAMSADSSWRVATRKFFAQLGIGERFVQDNHSNSRRNVLRGLHSRY